MYIHSLECVLFLTLTTYYFANTIFQKKKQKTKGKNGMEWSKQRNECNHRKSNASFW